MLAYGRVEPFGEQRADLRSGIIASTVANVNRGRRQKAFQPTDFMPYPPRRKPQTVSQIKQGLKAWVIASGGTVTHGNNS